MEPVNRDEVVLVALLAAPSMTVFLLSYADATPLLGGLSAAFTLLAVTLCPFIGSLLFERNESLILSLLIPFALTSAKALNYSGAERLVVAAFMVSLVASVMSWVFGCIIKYLYQRYCRKTA